MFEPTRRAGRHSRKRLVGREAALVALQLGGKRRFTGSQPQNSSLVAAVVNSRR